MGKLSDKSIRVQWRKRSPLSSDRESVWWKEKCPLGKPSVSNQQKVSDRLMFSVSWNINRSDSWLSFVANRLVLQLGNDASLSSTAKEFRSADVLACFSIIQKLFKGCKIIFYMMDIILFNISVICSKWTRGKQYIWMHCTSFQLYLDEQILETVTLLYWNTQGKMSAGNSPGRLHAKTWALVQTYCC